MDAAPEFVRYQATQPNIRGIYVGIFGLANGLARNGKLSGEDYRWWQNANAWYDAAYPDPNLLDPTVYDRARHLHAQAWFKSSAVHLLARIPGYPNLLDRYGVQWEQLHSSTPGRVLYEDHVQVVVDPDHRGVIPREAGPFNGQSSVLDDGHRQAEPVLGRGDAVQPPAIRGCPERRDLP